MGDPELLEASRSPAPLGPPAHPRRGGFFGLLRGLLQRLRGWFRGLHSLGPGGLVPGQQLLLIKRLGRGAVLGVGAKLLLASGGGSGRKEPLGVLLRRLRPYKATIGLAVAGAAGNAVLFILQLRYFDSDLSVVPPENRWQQALRTLFGARPPPPAQRGAPPLPAPAGEPKPAVAAGAAASAQRAEEERAEAAQQMLAEEVRPAAAAAAAEAEAGVSPAAAPLLPPHSPAHSFVDIRAGSPTLPAQQQPLAAAAAAQEGVWSDVPLGASQTASTGEDWTEVNRSGTATPAANNSPRAAQAAEVGEAAAAAAEGVGEEITGGGVAGGGPRLSFEHVQGREGGRGE